MNLAGMCCGRGSHRSFSCLLAVACVCLGLNSVFAAGGGNIFDDDWTPPKATVHPAAPPAPPVAPASVPTTPAPVAPSATASPPAQAITPPTLGAKGAQQGTVPTARRQIPAKADQARSRALLKEAFAVQLKDRSSTGRKMLAKTLMDEVPKTENNPSDQYVLLSGVIEASKQSLALHTCFEAADAMAEHFDVDALSIKVDSVLKSNIRGDSATTSESVQAALELLRPLMAAEDFTTGTKVLAAARHAAAGDASLLQSVQKRAADFEVQRVAEDRLAQHLTKLKASPDDPAANLAVASDYCFMRNDWERGLPLLAKGSDVTLKKLARMELSPGTTAEETARVADAWWDAAAKHPEPVRGAILQHAAMLYNLAIADTTGLRKTVIERRIADAAKLASAGSGARGRASDSRSGSLHPQWTMSGGVSIGRGGELELPKGSNIGATSKSPYKYPLKLMVEFIVPSPEQYSMNLGIFEPAEQPSEVQWMRQQRFHFRSQRGNGFNTGAVVTVFGIDHQVLDKLPEFKANHRYTIVFEVDDARNATVRIDDSTLYTGVLPPETNLEGHIALFSGVVGRITYTRVELSHMGAKPSQAAGALPSGK